MQTKAIDLLRRRTLLRAAVLASALAFAWLYLLSFQQFLFFGGGNGSGDDLGLATFLPALLIALGLSGAITLHLHAAITGKRNRAGFVAAGILSMPVWIALCLWLDPFDIPPTQNAAATVFAAIFKLLGLGLLPEGRVSWGGAHALGFLVILASSFIGLLIGN